MASIRDKNPIIFLEPKALYRNAEDMVPVEDYEVYLNKKNMILLISVGFTRGRRRTRGKKYYFSWMGSTIKCYKRSNLS